MVKGGTKLYIFSKTVHVTCLVY